jgi:hypothetical protein
MLDDMYAIHIKLHLWKQPCTGADRDTQTANPDATTNSHRNGHRDGDRDEYLHRKRNCDCDRHGDTAAAPDRHGHTGAGANGDTQAPHVDVYGRSAAAAHRYIGAGVSADPELDQYRATLRPE